MSMQMGFWEVRNEFKIQSVSRPKGRTYSEGTLTSTFFFQKLRK
jgi:hypothetical protein